MPGRTMLAIVRGAGKSARPAWAPVGGCIGPVMLCYKVIVGYFFMSLRYFKGALAGRHSRHVTVGTHGQYVLHK